MQKRTKQCSAFRRQICLIAFAASLLLNASAQRRPRPAPPMPDVQPFNIQVDSLTPHFDGHDIKAIYKDLAGRQSRSSKGEFETTPEFEARIKREAESPVLGKLDRGAYLAFVIENSSGEVMYDADVKTMTIAVSLASAAKNIYTPSDKKALTAKAEVRSEKYEGSNAFGAKAIVSRHVGTDYDVAFSNYQSFGMSRYISSYSLNRGHTEDVFASDVILVQIPMDIDQARDVKPRLKVLAIVKLVEPYTYEGIFYQKPTMDSPSEYFIEYHFLNTELIELWFYDDATGRVILKKKPTKR